MNNDEYLTVRATYRPNQYGGLNMDFVVIDQSNQLSDEFWRRLREDENYRLRDTWHTGRGRPRVSGMQRRVIPIAEEITWQTFKEADRFTQTAHIGAAGLALSLVASFPLLLIFGEGSWMSVLVTVMVAMYGLIFDSAILRLLYYWFRGVPITEQLEVNSGEDYCGWNCPKCGHLCGGIKNHNGAHEGVHGPCPKSGVKRTDLQYEGDSSER